jgi:hypothetical protein
MKNMMEAVNETASQAAHNLDGVVNEVFHALPSAANLGDNPDPIPSAVVHTTPAPLSDYILKSFAKIYDSRAANTSMSSEDSGSCRFMVLAKLPSTKYLQPVHYELECTRRFLSDCIEISFCPPPAAARAPVPRPSVYGSFKLYPAPFDCTTVTLFISSYSSATTTNTAATTTTPTTDALLTALKALHVLFARFDEIDECIYDEFLDTLYDPPPSNPFEVELTARSIRYDQDIIQRIPGSLKNSKTHYFQKIESADSAWGKAKTVVDCSADRCMSYLFCLETYEREMHHKLEEGDTMRLVIKVPNSASEFYVNLVPLGAGLSDRVFATWFTFSKDQATGDYILAFGKF